MNLHLIKLIHRIISQESEDNQELEFEKEIKNNVEQMDSTEEEENDDKRLTRKFSLDYMKQVLDYYDEVDQNGKRKHSWKSISHRFPHRQHIVCFRDYVSRGESKQQKLHEIDSYVFTMFKEARDQSLCIHDANLQRWAIAKARAQSMYEFAFNLITRFLSTQPDIPRIDRCLCSVD